MNSTPSFCPLKQGLNPRVKEHEDRSNLLPTMLCVVMEVSLEVEVVVVDVEIHRIEPGTNFFLVSYVAELIMRCSSVTSGLILRSWEKKRAPTQQTPMG
jgi:hypothetical protein